MTQSSSDSQLFIGKNVFLEKKAVFLGIKQSTSVLVQTQKNVSFAKCCCKFLAFFCFLPLIMLKMTISTSVWVAQHPNAVQNLQQLVPQISLFQKIKNKLFCRCYKVWLSCTSTVTFTGTWNRKIFFARVRITSKSEISGSLKRSDLDHPTPTTSRPGGIEHRKSSWDQPCTQLP